ncbi:hypothetical protein, partial [Acinetobacter baumannii]|uniref:hypothetical protein n=1 Tax=Acinetobacter baumannii TaxID=470 RepID=UPI001C068D0C
SNMAGKYTGLQARIREHSASALFIPCANHSLNLVGNCVADSCATAVHFFMLVQKLFSFF